MVSQRAATLQAAGQHYKRIQRRVTLCLPQTLNITLTLTLTLTLPRTRTRTRTLQLVPSLQAEHRTFNARKPWVSRQQSAHPETCAERRRTLLLTLTLTAAKRAPWDMRSAPGDLPSAVPLSASRGAGWNGAAPRGDGDAAAPGTAGDGPPRPAGNRRAIMSARDRPSSPAAWCNKKGKGELR